MKRKLALLLAMLLVTVLVVRPYEGQALSTAEKIDKELKQLQDEIERTQHNQRYAENTAKDLTGKKQATKEDIAALLNRIDLVQKRLETSQNKAVAAEEKLFVTSQQLEVTNQELEVTNEELKDSIKQLKNREELMATRVRLWYTKGAASYLDMLLSSTSYSDFINRKDMVESIVRQDSDIAEQKREYSKNVTDKKAQVEEKKEQVEQKKRKIEEELKAIKVFYTEMEDHKAELEDNERQKEVLISKLTEDIEELEEISDEAEKQLKEFARKASELEAKKNKIKNYYTGGELGMPLKSEYRLSSVFGYRIHPISGKKKLHAGIDMAAPKGTPVYAAESGVVIVAQSWSGYGNCIIIDHGGGLWTLYGHLMNGGIYVKKGETVKKGDKIGGVGSTGQSTGNHLHFEVRVNSEPVNPAPYLNLN